MKHGHVTPNPDGSKARCGGPKMCSVCALELANLPAQPAPAPQAAETAEEWKAELHDLAEYMSARCDKWAEIRIYPHADWFEELITPLIQRHTASLRAERDALKQKADAYDAYRAHRADNLESDSIVASCDCLTKTNEIQYHKPGCKYRLICERDALTQWKKEQLAVTSWWNEIDTFIRKHPDAPLGRSVANIALEWLKERDALAARVKDGSAAHAELRSLYAKTCSTIDSLRTQLATAQATVGDRDRFEKLANLWDSQWPEYPNTPEGEWSKATVICCVRELRSALRTPPAPKEETK